MNSVRTIMMGVCAAVAVCIPAGFLQAEVIRSFTSDITLRSDGTFTVTETIEYDFDDAKRHGIFRYLPTTHPQESERLLYTRYIDIDVSEVLMNGAPVPYVTDNGGGEIEVKIGDPDRTISGLHTYTIRYQVAGGLSYYENEPPELYWNVTGTGWEVPIEAAAARVHADENLRGADASCYWGREGAIASCVLATSTDGVATFSATDLAPGEGLTIAQELDPDLVAPLVLERLSLLLPWLVLAGVWLMGLIIFAVRHVRRYHTGRTIIAQYEAYFEVKPMYTGLLVDGRLDAQDITAGIVYLAEQGFFRIKKIERKTFFFFEVDDYEVTLRRPYTELATSFQEEIFKLLFVEDAPVGASITLHDLSTNTTKQTENQKTLQRLKKAANEDLIERGFFEHTVRELLTIGGVMIGVLLLLVTASLALGAAPETVLLPALFIAVGTIVALGISYRRRTRKGYEALDHLKGFKLFLSVTDTERFAFHNAPQKSPEQFMEYLPYAIAFGVEKEWAKVFDDITIPNPDWYEGDGGAFSAIYLTNSLSAFGATFTTSAGTSPSSGGGSVGGGAGGGGGGSW